MILSDEEMFKAYTTATGKRLSHHEAERAVFLKTHRAIEAAIIKKIGEPVCWITPDGEGWRMRLEPPVTETKLGWSPLFAMPKEQAK